MGARFRIRAMPNLQSHWLATLFEDMADQTHGARHHTKATDTCHSSPSQQIAPMALIGKSRS